MSSKPNGEVPIIKLLEVQLFERPVSLRLPFKFGAAVVTQCPQAFVRVRIALEGKASEGLPKGFEGASAELMVPKWFDKSPQFTHEQNFQQLRLAAQIAMQTFLDEGHARFQSAYSLSQRASDQAITQGLLEGLPRLAAQFGPALVDKAVADALLRALGIHWIQALSNGALGDPFSAHLTTQPVNSIHLRHTVGMLDRLSAQDAANMPDDGLPASLEQAVTAYGLNYFKLKLCGRLDEDLDRLTRIATVLEKSHPAGKVGGAQYSVTLDGNETFESAQSLGGYWAKLKEHQPLVHLLRRVLLLEQPLPRHLALKESLLNQGIDVPVILDESDDAPEVLRQGLALGYGGISSKACKGIYRSLHSAFVLKDEGEKRRNQRAEKRGEGSSQNGAAAMQPPLILSGEDLTCQAGLAVQQDSLLAASLGVTHVERNGHHYVDGFGIAPNEEAQRFATAHPGLYQTQGRNHRPQLAIRDGKLDLRSLYAPGFACNVFPTWSSLQEMPRVTRI